MMHDHDVLTKLNFDIDVPCVYLTMGPLMVVTSCKNERGHW